MPAQAQGREKTPHRDIHQQPRKGVRTLKTFDEYIAERRPEAWALLRKGGLSTKIARAFLAQHGTV